MPRHILAQEGRAIAASTAKSTNKRAKTTSSAQEANEAIAEDAEVLLGTTQARD